MSRGQQWAMHEWPIAGLQVAHAVQHGPFCGGHRHGLSQGPTVDLLWRTSDLLSSLRRSNAPAFRSLPTVDWCLIC